MSRYRGNVGRVAGKEVKSAPARSVKTAILSCRCAREYSPLPTLGDEVWCPHHREYVKVLLLQASYAIKCVDCRYARNFQRAHFAADKAGRKHHEAKGHTVQLWDGSKLLHTFQQGPEQLTLDDYVDDPPPY